MIRCQKFDGTKNCGTEANYSIILAGFKILVCKEHKLLNKKEREELERI